MKKYGLIGYPLTHSFSQRFFTEKFEREEIKDCTYSNFSLGSISELPLVLADTEIRGLNVTIPYKEQVLPFLHFENEVVREIRACNCIRIENGRRYGFNTDVIGFEASLATKLEPHHRQALVLGTGGAAKAVEYVLRKRGIGYRMVTRRPRPGTSDIDYAAVDAALLATHTLIVNTTPLGMHPHVDECPPLPYGALTSRHYLFDLIYNPVRTLFLQKGEEAGAVVENGYEMLILQAEESWRIWTETGDPARTA
ncbi:MAG TPA: shikimate dehydrogenase [Puia sp.]|jgi:shikimate dehydrogenase